MRVIVPAVALALAAGLGGCASGAPDGAEEARRTAEEYLHRMGRYDAQGVCDLGLSRDGRTPLKRNPGEMAQCVELFRLLQTSDSTRMYSALTQAKVHKVTVTGDHASVATADTEGAGLVVRGDRTLALLRVDGSWYVGSDDGPVAPTTR